jgi:hypothetical protein
MNAVVYVLLGWLSLAVWTAAGAHVGLGHVFPDAGIVVVVWVALRREPIAVTLTALAVGYFAGRQALAPLGLHEAVMVGCALTVYLTGGSLAGSGVRFYALASGGTVMLYHAALYLVSRALGGQAGFSGWATALLIPNGLATALLALAYFPLLAAVERRLTEDRREELSW